METATAVDHWAIRRRRALARTNANVGRSALMPMLAAVLPALDAISSNLIDQPLGDQLSTKTLSSLVQ
jgi:hypothetical protein